MKKVITIIAFLLPVLGIAQDIKEYKAINGITYHINDTVRLGKGSNNNGSFMYIEDRGLGWPISRVLLVGVVADVACPKILPTAAWL